MGGPYVPHYVFYFYDFIFFFIFRFFLSPPIELASRAGGSGWAEPTPGQENNRVDRAEPDLNRAAISLTQPGPISG